MRSAKLSPYERKMIHLSGPGVWPSLSAELVCDRYIFSGRPELRYLSAVQKLHEVTQDDPRIHDDYIHCIIILKERKVTPRTKRHFDHYISNDDPLFDVKNFLDALRRNLKTCLPQLKPILNASVQILFAGQPKKGSKIRRAHLGSYQRPWL